MGVARRRLRDDGFEVIPLGLRTPTVRIAPSSGCARCCATSSPIDGLCQAQSATTAV